MAMNQGRRASPPRAAHTSRQSTMKLTLQRSIPESSRAGQLHRLGCGTVGRHAATQRDCVKCQSVVLFLLAGKGCGNKRVAKRDSGDGEPLFPWQNFGMVS